MKAARAELDRLLRSVAFGDGAAFSKLYQLTAPKLFAVAVRILRNREAAEDVLQDCYVRVWDRARDFDPNVAAPVTWMVAIVRNRSLDELRRRNSRAIEDVSEIENLESADEHPLEALGRQEEVERLMRCLEGLEPERRQMVRLAYLDGLSRDELAKRFGRPEGTIKTWLHRSLAKLKGCLEQ